MAELHRSSLLVLGLVSERPRHAYEVDACIEQRRLREWTDIGFSSIYTILSRLERDGLLRSERKKVGARPARRVYRPTAEGRRRLNEEVDRILAQPTAARSPVCLALLLAADRDPAGVAESLRELAEEARRRVRELDAKTRAARDRWPSPLIGAIFAHDRALMWAEIRWAERTARSLDASSEPPASS